MVDTSIANGDGIREFIGSMADVKDNVLGSDGNQVVEVRFDEVQVIEPNGHDPLHHDSIIARVKESKVKGSLNHRMVVEWETFANTKLPDDLVLVPGVIDSTTNFVEHPKLVAERICRFANIVAAENGGGCFRQVV